MKILTVVGARPQFVKAATVSRIIRDQYAEQIQELIVHTGQHYDANMSDVFFAELDIPKPKYNLEISNASHGAMTGRMLEGIEKILLTEKPDYVLIYGDTNSTLAGALAAVKLHIPVAHVEAGLRSFNMRMPEEINRILADRVSSLLFCPTQTAVNNLHAEGITKGVHNTGDVMFDAALFYQDQAPQKSKILQELKLSPKEFVLTTCHRAENTDDPKRLENIVAALEQIALKLPVVLPLHPRTKKLLTEHQLMDKLKRVRFTEPLAFLDMIVLEQSACAILTDSGGVQKEAYFYQVPCITLRDETEWVETVELGWNQLVGADTENILTAFEKAISDSPSQNIEKPYGMGNAAQSILDTFLAH